MHGLSMGSLKVLMWQVGLPYPDRDAKPGWMANGEKGDFWKRIRLTLHNRATPYKVNDTMDYETWFLTKMVTK